MDVIPGLKGFGTGTRAAYGAANDPKIFVVTNTDHSNGTPGNSTRNGIPVKTGSFLEALNYNPGTNTGKIILFEVSGTINATSEPYTYSNNYPYTIIAGQTAPSPGITLRNIMFTNRSHDVLVQHIRSRIGDGVPGVEPFKAHALMISSSASYPNTYNVVFDHLSGSWAIDSNGLVWEEGGGQTHDCTWSNSIISEALHNSLHPKGAHSKGITLYADTSSIAFINNFIVSNDARNPNIRRGSRVVVNNYIYNSGDHSTQLWSDIGSIVLSMVGNLIEGGPSSGVYSYQNHFATKLMTTTSQIYLSDNKCGKDGVGYHTQADASDWSHVRWWGGQPDISADVMKSSAPIWPTGLVALDVDNVKAHVLANAGARPADRDSADQRVIGHAKSGGTQGKIIDKVSDVGGWPTLAENKIELSIPANPHTNIGGYTNLERWLHAYAAYVEGRSTSPPQPAVTCDQPTPHQPSGCALLNWSDTNNDGVINTTNTASGQLARGEITQEEFDFIEKAVNAGSINALCPGCFSVAPPAITCDNPTPHQPSGCDLLNWSDHNNDGVIATTNTATIQLANGEITQEEFDFIEKAVNAGSINAICPGCYSVAPIMHEVSIVVPLGAELYIDGKLVDTVTMTKLLKVLKAFIKQNEII